MADILALCSGRLTILISGAGIAGPTLAYWLVRRGHRPVLVERTSELRVGGHAVDIRGTALEVIERMGLDTAVRDARTQILTLSAVRPDGARTYDVALRPMHERAAIARSRSCGDDLVRILFGAVSDDVEVVFGDSVRTLTPSGRRPRRRRNSSAARRQGGRSGRRRRRPALGHSRTHDGSRARTHPPSRCVSVDLHRRQSARTA